MRVQRLFSGKSNFAPIGANKDSRKECISAVSFSGAENLLLKYKIRPSEIDILTTSGEKFYTGFKPILIKRLLQVHELAKKKALISDFKKTGYAANICLVDGTWGLPSANFNDTCVSSLSAENSAIISVFNKALRKLSLDKLEENPAYRLRFKRMFKAKFVVVSSAKPLGTDVRASTLDADCLSWLNSNKLFRDNTKLVFFDKDENAKLCIRVRSLKEILPYRGEKNSLKPDNKKLSELEMEITDAAKKSMEQKGISQERVLKLIKSVKNEQVDNKEPTYTDFNVVAGVMTNSRNIETVKRFEWSKSWFLEPAEIAAKKIIRRGSSVDKIDAIAYYGNGSHIDKKGVEHADGVVSLRTLGRLRLKHGDDSTLVITVVDGKIAVRTINDYMPKF